MNIIVTGANGQLGCEIRKISKRYNHNFIFTDIDELNICCENEIEFFFDKHKADVIINCAAYTAVDMAEKEENKAYEINSFAPKLLAEKARTMGAKLIHISTDYVFSGDSRIDYKEEDSAIPQNIYGKTKLDGEKNIIRTDCDFTIIRTSWLYSSFGNNFVKKILELLHKEDKIKIVSDQFGSPTYAEDLAKVILELINKKDCKGIYHYSNEGRCSWYEFAREIATYNGLDRNKIEKTTTEEYKTLAKRPKYSVLNKEKIKKELNIEIPHWKDSLRECIKTL